MSKLFKILAFVAVVLQSVSVFAQDSIALVSPGSKWINTLTEYQFEKDFAQADKNVVSTAYCIHSKDTIVNSKSYLQLDNCLGIYIGALREDSGRVFLIPEGSNIERKVYDFTLKKGDQVSDLLITDKNKTMTYALHSDVVISVDSVLVYGAFRKRINFAGASWVEGVGGTNGFLVGHSVNKLKTKYALSCMSKRNATLFPEAQGGACELPVELKIDNRTVTELIYPRASKDLFTMKFNRIIKNDEIYVINPQGKLIEPAMKITPGKLEVNLASYKSGKYLIVMRHKGKMAMGKLIKL